MDKIEDYIKRLGLTKTTDSELNREICRAPGFGEIRSYDAIDNATGAFFKKARKAQKFTRNDMEHLIGLVSQVYGRYETGVSKFTFARILHLCEVLDVNPIDLVYEIAPHFLGATEKDAATKVYLIEKILALDPDAAESLASFVQRTEDSKPVRGKAAGPRDT